MMSSRERGKSTSGFSNSSPGASGKLAKDPFRLTSGQLKTFYLHTQ